MLHLRPSTRRPEPEMYGVIFRWLCYNTSSFNRHLENSELAAVRGKDSRQVHMSLSMPIKNRTEKTTQYIERIGASQEKVEEIVHF